MSSSTPIPLPDWAPYTPVPRSERTVLVPFLMTVLLFSLTTYLTLCPPSFTRFARFHTRVIRALYRLTASLPSLPPQLGFLSLAEPDELAVAVASFSAYFAAQTAVLNSKHKAYYAQPAAHRRLAARLGWLARLDEVERCAEANAVVAGELAGLGMERARRMGVTVGVRSSWHRRDARVVEVSLTQPSSGRPRALPRSAATRPVALARADGPQPRQRSPTASFHAAQLLTRSSFYFEFS